MSDRVREALAALRSASEALGEAETLLDDMPNTSYPRVTITIADGEITQVRSTISNLTVEVIDFDWEETESWEVQLTDVLGHDPANQADEPSISLIARPYDVILATYHVDWRTVEEQSGS